MSFLNSTPPKSTHHQSQSNGHAEEGVRARQPARRGPWCRRAPAALLPARCPAPLHLPRPCTAASSILRRRSFQNSLPRVSPGSLRWGLPSSFSSSSSRPLRSCPRPPGGRRSAGTQGTRTGTMALSTMSRTVSAPTSAACSTPEQRYSHLFSAPSPSTLDHSAGASMAHVY